MCLQISHDSTGPPTVATNQDQNSMHSVQLVFADFVKLISALSNPATERRDSHASDANAQSKRRDPALPHVLREYTAYLHLIKVFQMI